MAKNGSKHKEKKKVETLTHDKAKRRNIPTAEFQSVMRVDEQSPIRVPYQRRNRDLDPQLVWRGKDEQDWSDLVVHAPPLYIQEKVQPKVLIDDLLRRTESDAKSTRSQFDLFADFNGLPSEAAKTEFYQHDAHWSNRLILGDSLQVMASLAEREELRGQVQCIYIDPPYGIKFNSNFQWSTTSREVKDGNVEHITREPEQVKAFRDTWRDGIHSYLTYLRDRLTVARDLLADSGSIFLQIGDENVHRVRAVMDEVFGEENFCNLICFKKTGGLISGFLPSTGDYLVWYCRQKDKAKFRQPYAPKAFGSDSDYQHVRLPDLSVRRLTREEAENSDQLPHDWKILQTTALESANPLVDFEFRGQTYRQRWKTNPAGLTRLMKADRIYEATAIRLCSCRRGSGRMYCAAEISGCPGCRSSEQTLFRWRPWTADIPAAILMEGFGGRCPRSLNNFENQLPDITPNTDTSGPTPRSGSVRRGRQRGRPQDNSFSVQRPAAHSQDFRNGRRRKQGCWRVAEG
jgi:adenine-specific DNA-methyltransferase